MRRALILSLLTLLCTQLHAQDKWDNIVDKIEYAGHLLTDSADYNPNKALSQLLLIEKDCTELDNDTLNGIFLVLKGQSLCYMSRYKECIAPCKEAIRLFERCNVRPYEYLDAFYFIATAYYRIGDFENAERYYRKGLIRSVAADVSSTDQFKADMFLNLGNLYRDKGDSILAEAAHNKSKLFSDSVLDIDNWNYIEWETSCWEKTDSLSQEGKYQEAIDIYSVMIPCIQKRRGKDKAYLLAVYNKAFLLGRHLKKYDEAIPLYKEVVEIGEKNSMTDGCVCAAYCNLVECYAYKGNYSEVDTIIQKSQSYIRRANNENYPTHKVYRFAGDGSYLTKNYEKAIQYYEVYLSPRNNREPGKYDDVTNRLSVSYILAGKPKKAEQLLQSFLKTEEKRLYTEKVPISAFIYHNLGRSIMLGGNKTEALKYLKKSKELQMTYYGEVTEQTLQYIEECNTK